MKLRNWDVEIVLPPSTKMKAAPPEGGTIQGYRFSTKQAIRRSKQKWKKKVCLVAKVCVCKFSARSGGTMPAFFFRWTVSFFAVFKNFKLAFSIVLVSKMALKSILIEFFIQSLSRLQQTIFVTSISHLNFWRRAAGTDIFKYWPVQEVLQFIGGIIHLR